MAMTRHFVDAVIKHGWKPKISSTQWIDFGRNKAGVYITFEGHEGNRYKCSRKIANEIIESGNVISK